MKFQNLWPGSLGQQCRGDTGRKRVSEFPRPGGCPAAQGHCPRPAPARLCVVPPSVWRKKLHGQALPLEEYLQVSRSSFSVSACWRPHTSFLQRVPGSHRAPLFYPDTSQLSPLSWGTLGTRSQICSPTHPHLLVHQQLQSPFPNTLVQCFHLGYSGRVYLIICIFKTHLIEFACVLVCLSAVHMSFRCTEPRGAPAQ